MKLQQHSISPEKAKRLSPAPRIRQQMPIEASIVSEKASVAVKKRLKAAKDPKEILELEKMRLQYVIEEEVCVISVNNANIE
jgi:hypothetical protein